MNYWFDRRDVGWLVIAPQMKTHVVILRKSFLPSHRGFQRKSWTNLKMCAAGPLGNHPLVHSGSFYTSSNTKLPSSRVTTGVMFKCEILVTSKHFFISGTGLVSDKTFILLQYIHHDYLQKKKRCEKKRCLFSKIFQDLNLSSFYMNLVHLLRSWLKNQKCTAFFYSNISYSMNTHKSCENYKPAKCPWLQ